MCFRDPPDLVHAYFSDPNSHHSPHLCPLAVWSCSSSGSPHKRLYFRSWAWNVLPLWSFLADSWTSFMPLLQCCYFREDLPFCLGWSSTISEPSTHTRSPYPALYFYETYPFLIVNYSLITELIKYLAPLEQNFHEDGVLILLARSLVLWRMPWQEAYYKYWIEWRR